MNGIKVILALHEREVLDFKHPTEILTVGKQRRDVYLTGVWPEGRTMVLKAYPHTYPQTMSTLGLAEENGFGCPLSLYRLSCPLNTTTQKSDSKLVIQLLPTTWISTLPY